MKKSNLILLASQSPRRKELLRNIGVKFESFTPDILENRRKAESPKDYVLRNSLEKAQAAQKIDRYSQFIILAADTVVVLNKKILEKPKNTAHAIKMLKALSGKTHKVLTGVSFLKQKNNQNFVVETLVTFKKLSQSEIASYVATNEPMDKAGAYGAQGFGAFMVKSVKGSYTNVIGLPMAEVSKVLIKDFKIELFSHNITLSKY